MSAGEFASVYIPLFKHDPLMRPSEIYEVLNEVFSAADCYRDDAQPGDPMEVSDGDLKQTAMSGLARLAELV